MDTTTGKTGNLLLPARWGIVRYGLGMTQTAAVETATAALCPWWFLRLFLVAVFERWKRDAFRGWSLKNRPESLKSSRVATTWNTSALMRRAGTGMPFIR